jgi:hypothetical protein
MPAFLHGSVSEKVSDDQNSLSTETSNDDVVIEVVVIHSSYLKPEIRISKLNLTVIRISGYNTQVHQVIRLSVSGDQIIRISGDTKVSLIS